MVGKLVAAVRKRDGPHITSAIGAPIVRLSHNLLIVVCNKISKFFEQTVWKQANGRMAEWLWRVAQEFRFFLGV